MVTQPAASQPRAYGYTATAGELRECGASVPESIPDERVLRFRLTAYREDVTGLTKLRREVDLETGF